MFCYILKDKKNKTFTVTEIKKRTLHTTCNMGWGSLCLNSNTVGKSHQIQRWQDREVGWSSCFCISYHQIWTQSDRKTSKSLSALLSLSGCFFTIIQIFLKRYSWQWDKDTGVRQRCPFVLTHAAPSDDSESKWPKVSRGRCRINSDECIVTVSLRREVKRCD